MQIKSLSPPPVLRPKAKVNSSATPLPRKVQASTSGGSTIGSPGASIIRAPSPSKIAQLRAAPAVSTPQTVKARLTPRPNEAPRSTQPETRQRALTTTPSDPALSVRFSARRNSGSSQTSRSELRSHSPLAAHRLRATASEENGSVSPQAPIRVKSKISRLAEPHVQQPLTPPNTVNRQTHGRVPSVGSLSPISTAIPTSSYTLPNTPVSSDRARFATTREQYTHKSPPIQPFPSNDDLSVRYGGYSPQVKVDPATIPLPPQSPPTSTLSFSSRSSASRSSVYDTQNSTPSRSTAPTVHSRVNGHGPVPNQSLSLLLDIAASEAEGEISSRDVSHRSDEDTLDDDKAQDSFEQEDSEDSYRKRRAAAKSNRKVHF